MLPSAPTARPAGLHRLTRGATRHLRHQIVIPYLLLAALFASGGTALLVRTLSQSRQEDFNQRLLRAAQNGANSLAQVEVQQLAGLRAVIYTQDVADALAQAGQTHDPASLTRLRATLRERIDPQAQNSRLERVIVITPDAAPLLDLNAAAEAPVARGAAPAPCADLAPFVQSALHPRDPAQDKTVGVARTPEGCVFFTAGIVRQGSRPVGTVLVGTYLAHLLARLARDSQSSGAACYGAGGRSLGYSLSGSAPPGALLPGLDVRQYESVRTSPAGPVPYRTISLAGGRYVEALAAVPSGHQAAAPAVYSVMLDARALNVEIFSTLWWLIPLFGAGLLLIIAVGRALAARIDRPLTQLVVAAEQVAQGNLDVQVPATREDELGVLARQFNAMVIGLRQLLFVKDLFGRFVSPEVSAQLLAGQIQLGGEQRLVTILFSDLRDFTRLTEERAPGQVVDLLNGYFRMIVDAAKASGGIVNKFGGDSTLIIFGAPVAMADQADRALATALAMRAGLQVLNAQRGQDGGEPLHQGIGITTGTVVAGQIGSEDRMEYTVIGDAVNLASRVQSMTKDLPGCDILFSGWTMTALRDAAAWDWQDQGLIQARGKRQPVQVYSLRGPDRLAWSAGAPFAEGHGPAEAPIAGGAPPPRERIR